MKAMVRMCAVSAAVIAALAGCGSQAQIGAGHPTPTHRACPEGSAYPPGTASEIDYIDSIWHDSVSYEYLSNVRITTSQIGSVVTRIQCSMATYPDTHAPPSRLADDTANVGKEVVKDAIKQAVDQAVLKLSMPKSAPVNESRKKKKG